MYNSRSHMIRGGLYVLLFQLLGGGVIFFIVYNNYQSITNSQSIKEQYKTTFSFQTTKTQAKKPEPKTGTGALSLLSNMPQIYSGVFGNIEEGKRNIGTLYNNKTNHYKKINIKIETHDNVLVILSAFRDNIIDNPTAYYLIKHANDYKIVTQTINDLNFLTKYIGTEQIPSPQGLRDSLDTILATPDNISMLIKYFNDLEGQLTQVLSSQTVNPWKNPLLSSPQFAYVYTMMHTDTLGMYRPHFETASQVFGLNTNLIKSCIMVEQLRAFYTFKGLFKSVAKTNKYLTIMSKQSFGIGGMKLATAEKLEQRLQEHRPDIFKEYFAYPNNKNIYQQRLARFTDTKNYYYQIMYSAGLLYRYTTERKDAGHDIQHNPGVIATMYNIGFSQPHANPDIGGAFLKIEGDKYSFGGLSMLMYYYLELFAPKS